MDGDNIRGEIIDDPAREPFGVIHEVPLRGLRFDGLLRPGEVENLVCHVHQRVVEVALGGAGGVTQMGVFDESVMKGTIDLDPGDRISPRFPPVIGNVQDVFHENVDIDENPVAFKILNDILLVLVAGAFLRLVGVGSQLLHDGRPAGEWGLTSDQASGIGLASRNHRSRGKRSQWGSVVEIVG